MEQKVLIRLVSDNRHRCLLLEVRGQGQCTGDEFCDLLEAFFPSVTWFFDGVALREAGDLLEAARQTGQQELIVSDVPIYAPPQLLMPRFPANNSLGPEPAHSALVVVEGPDPGGVLALRRGVYSLGRGATDLHIGDSRLSRRHALISVFPTSIVLNDEGSANGVWFAAGRVDSCKLMIGDVFRAGDSSFEVVDLRGSSVITANQASAESLAGSWPLDPIPVQGPEPTTRLALLLAGAITPLLMGVGLYVMTRNVFFLAFSAISIFTGGLPALIVLRGRAKFARTRLVAAATDAQRRADLAPPIGLVAAGLARSRVVATDGFPPFTLGTAAVVPWLGSEAGLTPGSTRQREHHRMKYYKAPGAGRQPRIFPTRSRSAQFSAPCGNTSPALLRLADAGSLVLEGESEQWAPLLRAMVVRWLPMLQDCTLRLLIIGRADFLPSNLLLLQGVEVVEGIDELQELGHSNRLPTIVLVINQPHNNAPSKLRDVTALTDLLRRPPTAEHKAAAPFAWIYCGSAPAAAHVQSRVDAQGHLVLGPEARQTNGWLAPSDPQSGAHQVSTRGGEYVKLQLARLSQMMLESAVAASCATADIGNTGSAPKNPSLAQAVLVPDMSEAVSGIRTVIGDGSSGPVVLDFAVHGPHFLVAGTTGSGKSELLRSMVLGLSLDYGPDELAFMLVDFKGGATLGPLARLPHVQSFVSDLDAAAARRVLDQLSAELRRREKLFAEAGANDHSSYLRARDDRLPLLPALVVVIDEFRVFSIELPGALENIVQLATVGRSLGIHLVLSTQRPAGALSAHIRANISTVIALRTIGEFESSDLIGSSAAAHLDPAIPGIALLRCSGGTPVKFRARLNARSAASVKVRAWGGDLGTPRWSRVIDPANVSAGAVAKRGSAAELDNKISQIISRWDGHEAAVSPFSAPLPLSLPALPRSLLRELRPGQIVVGMLDRVDAPHPDPLIFDPTRCQGVAVCGLPGSGVETVPEVLVRSINHASWVRACFVLDGDGTQEHLATVAGVCGYFGPQDSWRVDDFLRRLEDPRSAEPMVLIVSGIAGWTQSLGANLFQHFDSVLGAYARTLAQCGHTLVICGDKDLASIRAVALCETRWYFPCGAGPEVLMGWPKLKPILSNPGRGLLINPQSPREGSEFQLLAPDLLREARPMREPEPKPWSRNVRLPEVLCGTTVRGLCTQALAEEPVRAGASLVPENSRWPVGVSAPDNRLFWWSPGRIGIVIGRHGSGKHLLLSHLASISQSITGTTRIYGTDEVLPHTYEELGATAPELVVIERADLRVAEAAITIGILNSARIPLIISSEPSARLLFDLGLSSMVRDPRSFLVLDPRSDIDAEPADFRFTFRTPSVRGRTLVFDDGRLRQIQCVNED